LDELNRELGRFVRATAMITPRGRGGKLDETVSLVEG
jgi:hypothetical protein